MSEIRSACLLQRLDDGILSLTLCVRHAEGGALAPVRSTDRRVARSSPTRRDDFVRCDSAGARPKNFQTLNGYEAGLFGMEGRGAPSVVLFEKYLFSSIIFGADIF